MYRQARAHQRGLGWGTDYPDAEINFSIRLSEMTKTAVSRGPGNEPNHFVVQPTDDALFQCPFIIMSDPGSAGFTEQDVARLRTYLLKGGFLWADDYWGPWAWDDFAREIGKVLPPAQYPIQELTPEHPIFKTMFTVKPRAAGAVLAVLVRQWRHLGNGPVQRQRPHGGYQRPRGRVMVLMTHNTDISDAWEREGENPEYFLSFSPEGYAIGLNVALYAMMH